jgi:hypothetical protein
MGSLLNFRCPDELWASIEKLGKDLHPGGTHHRSQRDYDLTATMLDIVRAGISALENDPSFLNKTGHKTLDKTEVQAMVKEVIAASQTENKTIDKTEIQSMIQVAIANVMTSVATKKDLGELEETILNLIEEKQSTPTNKTETLPVTKPIETKEDERKSYDDSVNYIIELHRQKIPQKKIAEKLNSENYPTKSGIGQWNQSMVSGTLNLKEVKFKQNN